MNKKDLAQEIIQNPKVAATISTATAGTGIGTMFNWIPSDIGNLASLVGVVLSLVLIIVHLFTLFKAKQDLSIARHKRLKSELELRRTELEIEKLEHENKQLKQNIPVSDD